MIVKALYAVLGFWIAAHLPFVVRLAHMRGDARKGVGVYSPAPVIPSMSLVEKRHPFALSKFINLLNENSIM